MDKAYQNDDNYVRTEVTGLRLVDGTYFSYFDSDLFFFFSLFSGLAV